MKKHRNGQRLLSEREAAERLGIHPDTLRAWRREGNAPPWIDLAPHRKRPVVRYQSCELEAWLASRGSDAAR